MFSTHRRDLDVEKLRALDDGISTIVAEDFHI